MRQTNSTKLSSFEWLKGYHCCIPIKQAMDQILTLKTFSPHSIFFYQITKASTTRSNCTRLGHNFYSAFDRVVLGLWPNTDPDRIGSFWFCTRIHKTITGYLSVENRIDPVLDSTQLWYICIYIRDESSLDSSLSDSRKWETRVWFLYSSTKPKGTDSIRVYIWS